MNLFFANGIIVNTDSLSSVDSLIKDMDQWKVENIPQAMVRMRKYAVGPGHAFKFEARISGPGNATNTQLRKLAEEGVEILRSTPLAKDIRTDWREATKKIVAYYDQSKGRWTGISRKDLSRATQRQYDGFTIGQYREKDKLLPIIGRETSKERANLGNLDMLQVSSALENNSAPLTQIGDLKIEVEDPLIWRRNRLRTITIQAEPNHVTLSELRDVVVPEFEKMQLPTGYRLAWGAEYEDTVKSQRSLLPGLLPVILIVALILVAQFNSIKPPLIIALVIPFSIIGISLSLLVTQVPFGFMALLGAMSLAGMMIKNSIVLLDQITIELVNGLAPYEAIVVSALSRLRPVAMASATTILGVVPLLQDVFWISMAVVIMGGLLAGTVLTMLFVPVLYAAFYNVYPKEEGSDA